MADMFSDFIAQQGKPTLDKDYWKEQKSSMRAEMPNLFDDLIKTNFDVENLKGLSVFKANQK